MLTETLQQGKCRPGFWPGGERLRFGGSSAPAPHLPCRPGPPRCRFLTVFTAAHGRAVDGLVFFIVERVAIPIHWVVEKCEVTVEEEHGSEGLCRAPSSGAGV